MLPAPQQQKNLGKIAQKSAQGLKWFPVWSFRSPSSLMFPRTVSGHLSWAGVKMFFMWYLIVLECRKPRGNGRGRGSLIQMNPQLLLHWSSRKDVDMVIITAVCVLLLPAFSLGEQQQLVRCRRWGGRWESGAH